MHLHYGMPHRLIIDLGAEIMPGDVNRLRREFKTYLRRGVENVILRLEDLEVIDGDLFMALNDLHQELRLYGGRMIATGASHEIRTIMQRYDDELIHFDHDGKEINSFYAH